MITEVLRGTSDASELHTRMRSAPSSLHRGTALLSESSIPCLSSVRVQPDQENGDEKPLLPSKERLSPNALTRDRTARATVSVELAG
jgi:hypothetical protein